MPLSSDERYRIKYHLGYLATTTAASLSFGIPRPVETLFLVETAMNNVPEGFPVAKVRELLGVLDGIETKLIAAQTRLAAESIDSITLRTTKQGESEPDALEREYRRWGGRLADMLGVPFYPYSERYTTTGGTMAGNVKITRS